MRAAFAFEILFCMDDPVAEPERHYYVLTSIAPQIIHCGYRSIRLQVCCFFRSQWLSLYSSTTLKLEPVLLQSLVVPIVYFLQTDTMSNTTRSIKVSSENYQKLARLGTLEDSFNSVIERLLGIYYDQQEKQQQEEIQEQAHESQKTRT